MVREPGRTADPSAALLMNKLVVRIKRNQSGCPMFAPAYVGRKRRAKPIDCFYSFSESIGKIS